LKGPVEPGSTTHRVVAERGSRTRAFRRPAIVVVAAVAVTAGIFWFGPQKLFLDERVDEASPITEGVAGGDGSTAEVLAAGSFESLAHHAAGAAKLIRSQDGSTLLRFENFEVENGPDLRVYLSEAPADGDEDRLVEQFIDLGGLKGNIGNQNYALPGDVDPSRYQSAVVWCRRFSVGFAVAPLD
jgi:hypothetical protein